KCPKCQTEISGKAQFCGSCGYRLPESAPSAQAAPNKAVSITTTDKRVGFGSRFVASLLDGAMTGTAVILLTQINNLSWIAPVVVAAYGFLEVIFGYTPGKRITGLAVFDLAGRPPLPVALARRWLVKMGIPSLFLLLSFGAGELNRQGTMLAMLVPVILVMLSGLSVFGKSRQAGWDRASGTIVGHLKLAGGLMSDMKFFGKRLKDAAKGVWLAIQGQSGLLSKEGEFSFKQLLLLPVRLAKARFSTFVKWSIAGSVIHFVAVSFSGGFNDVGDFPLCLVLPTKTSPFFPVALALWVAVPAVIRQLMLSGKPISPMEIGGKVAVFLPWIAGAIYFFLTGESSWADDMGLTEFGNDPLGKFMGEGGPAMVAQSAVSGAAAGIGAALGGGQIYGTGTKDDPFRDYPDADRPPYMPNPDGTGPIYGSGTPEDPFRDEVQAVPLPPSLTKPSPKKKRESAKPPPLRKAEKPKREESKPGKQESGEGVESDEGVEESEEKETSELSSSPKAKKRWQPEILEGGRRETVKRGERDKGESEDPEGEKWVAWTPPPTSPPVRRRVSVSTSQEPAVEEHAASTEIDPKVAKWIKGRSASSDGMKVSEDGDDIVNPNYPGGKVPIGWITGTSDDTTNVKIFSTEIPADNHSDRAQAIGETIELKDGHEPGIIRKFRHWKKLNRVDREKVIKETASIIAKELGLETVTINISSNDPRLQLDPNRPRTSDNMALGLSDSVTGEITINPDSDLWENPRSVLETLAHEIKHQQQDDPSNPMESPEARMASTLNSENYHEFEDDPIKYLLQHNEADAESFADKVGAEVSREMRENWERDAVATMNLFEKLAQKPAQTQPYQTIKEVKADPQGFLDYLRKPENRKMVQRFIKIIKRNKMDATR
ncbi:MAG: RDD family protein, partial [Verrucomicrobiota bacterium]